VRDCAAFVSRKELAKDAPIMALKGFPNLKAEIVLTFASDILPAARKVLMANSAPQKMFHSLVGRDPDDVPDHDLYIAGFPCRWAAPYTCVIHPSMQKKTNGAFIKSI